jgi:hypothetical protein
MCPRAHAECMSRSLAVVGLRSQDRRGWLRGSPAMTWGGVVVLSAVASIGLWAAKSPSIGNGARGCLASIEASPARIDFGSVPEGNASSRVATIFNRGSRPISILDVVKSCGCTNTALSDTHLMPGRSVSIVVSLRPEPREKKVEGQVRVRYRVDGESEPLDTTISISAKVEPEFKIQPESLTFVSHQRAQQEFVLVPVVDSNLRLVGVESDNPALTCRETASHTVIVAFDPGKWDRSLVRAHVFVRTSNATHPLEVVPVRVVQSASLRRTL